VDEQGVALGLVYSDDASIRAAVERRKGIYHSRRRGLWEKGLSSGATQDLIGVTLDCDRDALRFPFVSPFVSVSVLFPVLS
jgi:phosphoribosyl-AMP cyclohydrolase